MSSHHFVKDGQEPALIIANGQSCEYDLLTQVLEWCPLVVACDGAFNRLSELSITPDVIIGDGDSLGNATIPIHTKLILDHNQENTDLEKAIDYIISLGYDKAVILWGTGLSLDHTLNNCFTLAKYPKMSIVMYDDHSKCFLLPKEFKKVYKKNQIISLLPLGKVNNITTSNLVYELNNESLEIGIRTSSSNSVKENGLVTIIYDKGKLILIERK